MAEEEVDVDSYFLPGGILDSPSKDDLDHPPLAGVDEFFPAAFGLGGLTSKAATSRVLGAQGVMGVGGRGPSQLPLGPLGEEGRLRLSMEGTNPMAKEFTPSIASSDPISSMVQGQHFFPNEASGYLETDSPVIGHGAKGAPLASPRLDAGVKGFSATMLSAPPGVVPPPLLDMDLPMEGKGGAMSSSILASPGLVGEMSPGATGPQALVSQGQMHAHAMSTGLQESMYNASESLQSPMLSVSLSAGPSPSLLPQPSPLPAGGVGDSSRSPGPPGFRTLAPVVGPSSGLSSALPMGPSSGNDSCKSSLFSSSPQQFVAPEPHVPAPLAPVAPKAWSTAAGGNSRVQSPASDAPKGGNQPGKESASMSVKGTATSRSSTLAAAAKVTRKPEMGGAREPTPVGSAQQQAPQAKQPYLATVLGGSGRAAGSKPTAPNRAIGGKKGDAPPASTNGRKQADASYSSASSSTPPVTAHQSGSTPGAGAQQTKGGASHRKGPAGTKGTAVKEEQRRWADVAYSMVAETSIKSTGPETQETAPGERSGARKGPTSTAVATTTTSRRGKPQSAIDVKQQQQQQQDKSKAKELVPPQAGTTQGAAQQQGPVQGQPQPVTTLHTASPPNASASERFSDRVSESDSSEDSTVSSLTDENSSHDSKEDSRGLATGSAGAAQSQTTSTTKTRGERVAKDTGRSAEPKEEAVESNSAVGARKPAAAVGGKGGKKAPTSVGNAQSPPFAEQIATSTTDETGVSEGSGPSTLVAPTASLTSLEQHTAATSSVGASSTTGPHSSQQKATTQQPSQARPSSSLNSQHRSLNCSTTTRLAPVVQGPASKADISKAPPPPVSKTTTPSRTVSTGPSGESSNAGNNAPSRPMGASAAGLPWKSTVKAAVSVLPEWAGSLLLRVRKAGVLSLTAVVLSWLLDLVVAGVGCTIAIVLAGLLVVMQLHRHAFIELGSNTCVALCFAVPYLFKSVTTLVMDWAPHWCPVCLWYLFLVQMFWSSNDTPASVNGNSSASQASTCSSLMLSRPSRVVLPLLLLAEGVSRQSFLLDLNGPELLLLSFLLAAIKFRRLTSPIFLLSWAFQVLLVNYLDCSHTLWQYAQFIMALTSLRAMSVVDAVSDGSASQGAGNSDIMMVMMMGNANGHHKADGRMEDSMFVRGAGE